MAIVAECRSSWTPGPVKVAPELAEELVRRVANVLDAMLNHPIGIDRGLTDLAPRAIVAEEPVVAQRLGVTFPRLLDAPGRMFLEAG
jgi:hypothetical protein